MDAQLKVSRSVTKAAFSHPFWGSCMLSLKVMEDESIPTACTDGQRILWSRKFVDTLNEDATLGLMVHEVCHVVFQHCQPWEGKDPKLCNVAMDYVINAIIDEEGFTLPEGGIKPNPAFKGMTWQQVYAILEDIDDKYNKDSEGSGAADKAGLGEDEQKQIADQIKEPTMEDVMQNSDMSDAEKEELKQKIEQMTVQAAENAKAQGVGRLPAGMEDLITKIRKPKVDWRERIRTTLKNNFPEDYTMRKPNKKFLHSAGVYMPSMEGNKIKHLGIGMDTSGSVMQREKEQFLGELNAISQEFNIEKVSVFYADAEVANVEEFSEGEEITQLNAAGGGGTSFAPVFDYIYEQGIEVDQLIYFSDMEVYEDCFPDIAPDYPTLWVSTRAEYNVPFGELVVMDINQ